MTFGLPFRYETGPDGFILSGPKYFKKFHDIMLSMVTRYGVNMFKVCRAGHLLVSYGVGLHCVQPEPYWRIRY